MNTSLDRVRELNFDHHRRMTLLAQRFAAEGKQGERSLVDDQSYRRLLVHVPRDRRFILELGSSMGGQWPLLREWLKPGGVICGLDLYEPYVTAAQQMGLDIFVGFVEEMDKIYSPGIADMVCSRHVMEHLGDVDGGINQILRVTASGGYIAHVTPDMPYDDEPAHLNKWNLDKWVSVWEQYPVKIINSEKLPFNGGEVHIVCQKTS